VVPSAIGSNVNENVDVEELGVEGEGGTDVVGDRTSSENCPSRTDCFRACDWMPRREHQYVQVEMERTESSKHKLNVEA
jgi:hypothetical protein